MFFHIAFRCQFYNLFLTWCPKTWFWDLLLNRLVPKIAPQIWFFEKTTSFSQRCGRPPAVLEATGATEAARGAQSIIFMIFDTFRLHFHGFVTNVWLITGSFFIELWQIVVEWWHCFRTYFCRSPNDKTTNNQELPQIYACILLWAIHAGPYDWNGNPSFLWTSEAKVKQCLVG